MVLKDNMLVLSVLEGSGKPLYLMSVYGKKRDASRSLAWAWDKVGKNNSLVSAETEVILIVLIWLLTSKEQSTGELTECIMLVEEYDCERLAKKDPVCEILFFNFRLSSKVWKGRALDIGINKNIQRVTKIGEVFSTILRHH